MHFTSEQFKFTHQTNTYKGNIRICIVFGIIALLIGKVELENIFLYEQGQTAKAYVYRHTSKGRRGVSLYEFKVDGIRYTGQDQNSEVGNYIEIVYLPQKPKINRNAKAIDKDWCVWASKSLNNITGFNER